MSYHFIRNDECFCFAVGYTPGSEGTTVATVTYVDGQPTLTSAHPIEGTYGPNGEINVTVEPVTVDGQQVKH